MVLVLGGAMGRVVVMVRASSPKAHKLLPLSALRLCSAQGGYKLSSPLPKHLPGTEEIT